MICENCNKQINENSATCPECGVIINVEKQKVQDVVIEQPVVNQVIEEEHKAKMTKKDKKIILTTISVIFFALSIATIIIANLMPEHKTKPLEAPVPTIKPQETTKISTIEYSGYNVGYLSDYEASIENELLILEGSDLYFQIRLHSDATKELLEQKMEPLKQELKDAGYTINKEETTIRSGIEFYLLDLSITREEIDLNFQYFLTVENEVAYEILVYEIKDGNYAKVSNQLRTIVKNTKLIN